MTEDFKKGLATGIAIGGVTVVKPPLYGIQIGDYQPDTTPQPVYSGTQMTPPSILSGDYTG